jgi:hypothetical protein
LRFRELFKDTRQSISGVIDDDIDAPKLVQGGLEGGVDIGLFGDVELDWKEVLNGFRGAIRRRYKQLAFSLVPLNLSVSVFRAVATAMSPWSRTS